MDVDPFPYWIGFDGREPDAYDVCSFSCQRKSSIPLHVRALRHKELRSAGLFTRSWGVDPMTGHLLSHPVGTQGAYTARCGCGLDLWGRRLWKLWEAHQRHLAAVQAASQARHPSQRREKP